MPLTENIPKCLLEINGKTILDIEIENLVSCFINSFIITTGFQHEKIERYIEDQYQDLDFELVFNDRYDSTNYIYSLWLAKDLIDDDIILLHGDLVFELDLLKRLLADRSGNAVLVNSTMRGPQKDFKAVVRDNMVREISVNASGENTFFCAPMYKFSREGFLRWFIEIEAFITRGEVECYAEDALNRITEEIELKPIYYGNEFCMEIDTPEDLRIAKEYYRRIL